MTDAEGPLLVTNDAFGGSEDSAAALIDIGQRRLIRAFHRHGF
jgi:hypothetical protein